MSHSDLTLIEEFAQETLELLAQLGDACGRLNSGQADETQLATIDRGLHTLKGNAAALGLKDLSHASAALLDRWRDEGTATLALVWRYLGDCRRYVVLVAGQRKPPADFFHEILDPKPVPRAIVKKAPQRLENVVVPTPDASLDEILASVPELSPDIRGLVAKAAEHLRAQGLSLRPQSQPSEAPTATVVETVAPPENDTPSLAPPLLTPQAQKAVRPAPKAKSDPAPALQATVEEFEESRPAPKSPKQDEPDPVRPIEQDLSALRSHDVSRQLLNLRRRLATNQVEAPELESALRFLEQLQDGQNSRSLVPLQEFLERAVAEIAENGVEAGRELLGSVDSEEVTVLEPLGELVRYQVTEILRGRLCTGRIASLESRVEYAIDASASGDQLLIVMRGLGRRPRMSALDRLRQQTSMDFVQDLGGRLQHGDQVGELELSMDIGAVFTAEVCLLETADARFYLPAPCVASAGDLHPGSSEIVVRTSSGPRRMKLRSMEERETLLVAAADEESAAAGLLGHCLCIRRGERIPLLDPDSL